MPVPSARRSPRAVAIAAAALALLLLAWSGPAPAHRSTAGIKRCSSVPFTPNSEDVAADIRVMGLSCAQARRFIRSSEGRPAQGHRGYTCARHRVETSTTLPHTRYRCVKGARMIRWKRF